MLSMFNGTFKAENYLSDKGRHGVMSKIGEVLLCCNNMHKFWTNKEWNSRRQLAIQL